MSENLHTPGSEMSAAAAGMMVGNMLAKKLTMGAPLAKAIDGDPSVTPDPATHEDGSPIDLDPMARYGKLKAAGLGTGWQLMTHGEMIIMDRNFRSLVLSYNKLADTAYEQRAALVAAETYAHTIKPKTGAAEIRKRIIIEMVRKAIGLVLPERTKPKLPEEPQP